MIYGSICSGIEAATVAWHPLGWQPSFFSEIEAAPRAVLQHHYPEVPLHGDFTTIKKNQYRPIDLLVGGTPCQDFSVAGLRKGIAGDRGNLTLEFLRLAQRLKPCWLVYENVPGIFSSDERRAFGAFLGGMGKLGYGFAYRVLDAQYYHLAQRRERVFVVGYLGDWRPPAAVLFESESMRGDPPPRRETGQGITHDVAPIIGASGRGFSRAGETRGQDPVIAHTLRGEGFDASEDGSGRGTPLIHEIVGALDGECGNNKLTHQSAMSGHLLPMAAFDCKGSQVENRADGIAPTLRSMNNINSNQNGGGQLAVAFESRIARNGRGQPTEVCPPLKSRSGDSGKGDSAPLALTTHAVRRLTPTECERLQGLPDNYTLVPFGKKMMADGPRYRMIGNSMPTTVMRKLGKRIDFVTKLMEK